MFEELTVSQFVSGSVLAIIVYFVQRVVAQYDSQLDDVNKRTDEMIKRHEGKTEEILNRIHAIDMKVTRIEVTIDRKGNWDVS